MTRIVALSDTHSYHRRVKIPEGDLLIHAGDITWRGEMEIFTDFAAWLKELPHARKVIICGNHELGMAPKIKRGIIKTHSSSANRDTVLRMLEDAGATYLENSGCEINGLHFYGSPTTPRFFDWEFNIDRNSQAMIDNWNLIPKNTNVLITHGPPYGILDSVKESWRPPQGCEVLRKRIDQLPNLKAHFFGHLHHGYGIKTIGQTVFANVAICDDNYNTSRPATVIDI
jgi:Icc-related predicted phosphoesterase